MSCHILSGQHLLQLVRRIIGKKAWIDRKEYRQPAQEQDDGIAEDRTLEQLLPAPLQLLPGIRRFLLLCDTNLSPDASMPVSFSTTR